MITQLLIRQIVILFIMMGLGFLLVKVRAVKSQDSKILSLITVYLIFPCVIISSFQIEYSDSIRNGFLLALGAAVIIHIILFILCFVFGKLIKLNVVEKTSLVYSNAGALIVPLVSAVLGDEWVIYASAFLTVQLLILWTHGQSLMQGRAQINWKKILTNINLLAVIAGLIIFFGRITLPGIVTDTISSISDTVGPISMIMIGMLLAGVNWKSVFSGIRIYIIVVLKMIVFPLIVLLFLKYSGTSGFVSDGKQILLISLMAVITPSATTVTQMALIYDQDAEYAGTINALTTLVSIATMPLMVMLYLA